MEAEAPGFFGRVKSFFTTRVFGTCTARGSSSSTSSPSADAVDNLNQAKAAPPPPPDPYAPGQLPSEAEILARWRLPTDLAFLLLRAGEPGEGNAAWSISTAQWGKLPDEDEE